ncbi:MAG: hypothetical protein VB954_03960 [Thalassolituus sp.]|jgi:hypothetical protein|uniref:Uncharacterized protein n=2 Tax=root TaxID=1 RepID=M5DU14_9GAMM|nr:hypothetical protein [Thalassolituus oleivorans]PCI50705.1 MAG: hypothetical protein COB43_00820 [Oceanospirillales bacterium]AHK17376.1 hypothetical protein R615_04620 [Thalassolituus oleivorans R6-15]APR66399.1 hypothetical protein CN03_05275 [Thalassolituus oleivorans]MBQ0729017.1 hypothetical protein [Thalassolituus oleivorans]MBQ0782151.1 hypothetical protein [Thalassolituus oleivorans]|tara:strand:+ start:4531 stop:4992 length:462 start_codon:yes stop_codon:yes gene_type:complete
MKLFNFTEDNDFNQLKKMMGAAESGDFTDFDPEHQLTYGERETLKNDGMKVSGQQLRILRDKTLALKNSRVWVKHEDDIHIAGCPIVQNLRHQPQSLELSTAQPTKQQHICIECLTELQYLGIDQRRSRRLADQVDELFSMTQFQQDYPVHPI